MSTAVFVETLNPFEKAIQEHVTRVADEIMAALPDPERLSAEQRRGLIARYADVMEGNFIYWMTGTLLPLKSEGARTRILENLNDEVRGCHPGMLRRFTLAAHAQPSESDAAAVYENLSKVRAFVSELSAIPMLVTMAFFEGWIQRFMPYLADLAERQGSKEREYTDVHSVCDVGHTQDLYRALAAEMAVAPPVPGTNLYEGVDLLRKLILNVISPMN